MENTASATTKHAQPKKKPKKRPEFSCSSKVLHPALNQHRTTDSFTLSSCAGAQLPFSKARSIA